MEILWDDRTDGVFPEMSQERVTEAAQLGLLYTNAPEASEVSVSLVNPEEIQQLNREYRNVDRETDVLSFPFDEYQNLPGQPVLLGDIVICPRVAESQAQAYGHSFEREMAFLMVHGLLHLMGYDHEEPEDEQRMLEAQDNILHKAGIDR